MKSKNHSYKLALAAGAIAAALVTTNTFAQQGMGIGNNNPQEMLDVSGAIKLGTTTTTNAGTIRWTGTEFQGWDGTQWITFGGGIATQLTEAQVEAFITNGSLDLFAGTTLNGNAILTTEVDGSITNEIQDLNLTGNILTITNNGSATSIDLSPYVNSLIGLDDAYDNGSTITADAGPVVIDGPDGLAVTGDAFIGGSALIFGNAEIGNDAFIGGNADILGTLNLPNGAAADYIAVSDATGAVTWTDPATITTGDDGDWTVNGTDISNANTGNVGIGTNAPTEILDVNGQIRMRTGATSGYVPASDANGVMIWTDPNTLVTPTTTIFANTSGVTSNENGTYATDDFVFGSPQLADNGNTANDNRFFFDKSKSAFRAGRVTGTQWDAANIGNHSTAMGSNTTASGDVSTAMGEFTSASGFASTAMGVGTTASGNFSTAMGRSTTAPSYAETSVGRYNTTYTPASTTAWNTADRLFVVGNGTGAGVNSSNALTIYKDGKMNINDAYDMPTADGAANFVMSTDGAGVVSFVDPNTLVTPTTTIFANTSGVTSNENGTYATDDFVFGAAQLDNIAGTDDDKRLFFDKSKGAFRAGRVTGTQWDAANIGNHSTAMGVNASASGGVSTAMGSGTTASGFASTVMGSGTTASGFTSTAMGENTTASGNYSTAMGERTTAPSFAETSVGRYNTTYTPSSITTWSAADRLFVVGNGTGSSARSNALTIYKNGTMNINDAYDMPTADGTANFVMSTDGNGVVSFVDPNTLVTPTTTIFANTSGVTSNENGTYASDDFVFGSPQLADNGNTANDNRFFFDKSRGSFRAGRAIGTQWDDANVGDYSVALGNNTTASGGRSTAMGGGSTASGNYSTAMGSSTTASGNYSTAMGERTTAPSFAETAIGRYTTTYTPASATGWNNADRLFVIGNGTGTGVNSSNALTITKDGTMNINDAYDMPTIGGTSGQVLTTNGTVATWTDPADDGDWTVSGNDQYSAVSGNVGIGTSLPVAKLDIAGTTALNDNQLRLRGGTDGNHWLSYHGGGGFDGAKLYGLQTVALQTNNMEVVLRNGRLGVGTASPGKGKLHVAGWQNDYVNAGTYFSAGFGGLSGFGNGNQDISIYGERHILAGWGLLTESDARIKNIQGISDGVTDLETLTQIEITDYTMKDYVQAGTDAYKKVIAQQVESVYPLAVSNTTNFIPNVYELTQMENGKASVETNLEEGDKVKLYINDSEEAIANVVSKTDNTVSFDIEYTGKAFIYGKEVDDFKIVDYEAIAMLNVSATQELFKMIQNLKKENSELKSTVDGFKAMAEDIEKLKEWTNFEQETSK